MADTQRHFPLKLTQAQRKVVAEIAPELADRLKLDERRQRTIPFTLAELKAIRAKAGKAMLDANTGMVRNSLRHVTDLAAQALERSQGIGVIPVIERVYQFKITHKDSHPPIWRRILVKDGTLDKLHEHIQCAGDYQTGGGCDPRFITPAVASSARRGRTLPGRPPHSPKRDTQQV
jgi:pRiA4b ORF-3-like protein